MSDICGVTNLECIRCNPGACESRRERDYSNLPTADEYKKFIYTSSTFSEWSEPKYQCPVCGGGMCKNQYIVLTTYPVQFTYRCDQCGYMENQFG